jgi:hypothetical protein
MLIQEYAVPAEARSVSISIDRVALPMEEPIEAPPVPVDPPWVAAVIAAAPPHPPEVQAVLDEQTQGHGPKVARNFRMAYAATVTLHNAEGESIHTIRYGRMPKGDVRGLCRGLARDVTAMRAQQPDLKVAYLTDGATEFETLYDQHLMKRPGARWKHATGDEVMQLRALQLSDRWAPAVQRATRPLAKAVQIAASVYAAKSTKTAPITGAQGTRATA